MRKRSSPWPLPWSWAPGSTSTSPYEPAAEGADRDDDDAPHREEAGPRRPEVPPGVLDQRDSPGQREVLVNPVHVHAYLSLLVMCSACLFVFLKLSSCIRRVWCPGQSRAAFTVRLRVHRHIVHFERSRALGGRVAARARMAGEIVDHVNVVNKEKTNRPKKLQRWAAQVFRVLLL